jgi:hypothetical protein
MALPSASPRSLAAQTEFVRGPDQSGDFAVFIEFTMGDFQ